MNKRLCIFVLLSDFLLHYILKYLIQWYKLNALNVAKNSKTYPQNGQNPSVIQLVEADFGTQTTEKLYGKLNPCLEMSKNQCKGTIF